MKQYQGAGQGVFYKGLWWRVLRGAILSEGSRDHCHPEDRLSRLPTDLKAHTYRAIFRGFVTELAVESANSIPELDDYTTDSVIVSRLSLSNMFNIFLTSWNRPTGIGRLLQSPDGKPARTLSVVVVPLQ